MWFEIILRVKKTLSILMLLMANVLILAHAVIPHHHHDKVAVAIFKKLI